MKFKLLGSEIYISFLFVAVISLMLATDKTGLALPTLFAVGFHEIGHLLAMWIIGTPPKSIRLIPASVQITRNISDGYKGDIKVALAGPIVNFILFLTLYINYLIFGNDGILYYSLINLIIGFFNLLPVTGLDGGTVLFSVIAKKSNVGRAMLVLRVISLCLGAICLFLGITLTLRGKINVSVYIISIYLFLSVLIKI